MFTIKCCCYDLGGEYTLNKFYGYLFIIVFFTILLVLIRQKKYVVEKKHHHIIVTTRYFLLFKLVSSNFLGEYISVLFFITLYISVFT